MWSLSNARAGCGARLGSSFSYLSFCRSRTVDDLHSWMGKHIPWMVAVTGGSCYPSRGGKSMDRSEKSTSGWGGSKNSEERTGDY